MAEPSPELHTAHQEQARSTLAAPAVPPPATNGPPPALAAPSSEQMNGSAQSGPAPSSAPLRPTPAPAAPPPPASSTSTRLDAVVYTGFEIQVQFPSPYPLEELQGNEEKAASTANGASDKRNQGRETGGRFGKKKAGEEDAGRRGSEAAVPSPAPLLDVVPFAMPPATTNGTSYNALEAQVPLDTASVVAEADLDSIARERTQSFASTAHGEPLPTSLPPPTLSAPQAEVPDSHPSSPRTEDDFELPFQLPVSTLSSSTPAKSSVPVDSTSIASSSTAIPPHSTLPTPLTSAALAAHPQPEASSSSSHIAYPPPPASDSASTARGRAGRFLAKPPGTTQKAQRAAARAAKAAGGSANGSDAAGPHLTQRQQREIAKKAREETLKLQAQKDKELAKTRERERLFVCDKCFKYFAVASAYTAHSKDCSFVRPPGRRVYQRGAISIWEVDGATAKLYCQNLCLFAKLFIEHKYMFFDVEGFVFYILTEATSKQEWTLGYFSKEKLSYDDYNLACIVVFPPFRQKGWATLLIEFSYELSRRLSSTPGTPERPLSDLGAKGYLAHWTAVLVRYFHAIFALRAEPPLIDTLLATSSSNTFHPSSSPVKDEPEDGAQQKKRPRRSKGWDGELPPGTVTLASALSGSPAKAFTLRVRRSGPRQPSSASDAEYFDFPTTLEDLAEAVNLRADDVAFALVESGLAQYRRGGRKKKADGGEGEEEDVKMEDSEGGGGEEEEAEEEGLVITAELVELVARERRTQPLPMLDVAYVTL